VTRHRRYAAVQPRPAASQRRRALAGLIQRCTAATLLPHEVVNAISRDQVQEIAGPAREDAAARIGHARQHVTGISRRDHHDGQFVAS
jgi:hypothetical protein